MILAIDQGTTGTTCLCSTSDGAAARPRLPRVHAALSAARLGRARRRRDLGRDARRWRTRRSCRPASRRATLRGDRHHQPARDRRRLGRAHRRAAAQRDRVAGPPHRRRAATSCASRASRSWCAQRTGLVIDPYFSGTKIEWMLEHVDGLRERARRAACASGRSTRGSLQAHRPGGDRLLERVAHDAVRHRRRCAGTTSCATCSACPLAALPGGRAFGRRCLARPTRTPSSARACRSRASRATSRPRCSARPASSPASARTRTGPAASCCRTPGASRRRCATGLLTTVAWGIERRAGLRARGERVRDRRRGAVAARRARDHRGRQPRPRRWPPRSTPTTAFTSCRR